MVFSYTILTPVLRPGWSEESGNLLCIRRASVTQALGFGPAFPL
jgi:hypothetical protein